MHDKLRPQLPRGHLPEIQLMIFDAGTGLLPLGRALACPHFVSASLLCSPPLQMLHAWHDRDAHAMLCRQWTSQGRQRGWYIRKCHWVRNGICEGPGEELAEDRRWT